jgi:hypothetical protein
VPSKSKQAADEILKEALPKKKGRPKKPRKPMHPNSLKALAESRVPFKKNNPETGEKDPRINRKGSPPDTMTMRALIRAIGADLVQLQDTTNTGRKRTKIVSRITKKIIDMYESNHPADSTAILKAGYPGLLDGEEEGKKGPKEFVLKVVYENKRPMPDAGADADVLEGEEAEPGGVGELGDGHQEPDADLDGEDRLGGRDRGAPFVGGHTQTARWGLDILQHENQFSSQDDQAPEEEPED